MNNDITYYVKNRYTSKAYDASKKISTETVEKMKELLRFAASSTNSQPWHFLLVSSDEGKEKLAKATDNRFSFNSDSIRKASHVVVFARRLEMTEEHLLNVLAQEEKDGRFVDNDTFKSEMHAGRSKFVNFHKNDIKDVDHWMEKQVYLNVGSFLLGVSTLGLDATPMEGFEATILDAEFGLHEQGYTSVMVVAVGYHDEENDYNAALPKSRLEYETILTEV